MNITEAKRQVKDTVEAYLAQDDMGLYCIPPDQQRPLFLVGAPGIGKTAIVSQVASEIGIPLVSYSMTHHTRQSALGLPKIVHRGFRDEEFDVTEYTMSEIIASTYEAMERTGRDRGILFLDEVNCVSETLYPSMLQFLQFKTFGGHHVPDGWVIVCAGNPPAYNRSVHEFDVVMLDRLRTLEIDPDFESWKAYARNAGVHPAILSFLEVKHDCFYTVRSTPTGKRFVTARGWTDLSRLVSLFEQMGKPVDESLVVQFVQDEEVAESFSLYYDLFRKYRAHWQIPQVLEGHAPQGLAEEAADAPFEERLAVVGLLADGIAERCDAALLQMESLLLARDALRVAKVAIGEGADLAEALRAPCGDLEQKARDHRSYDEAGERAVRTSRMALKTVRALQARCETSGRARGAEAAESVSHAFESDAAKLQPLVDGAQTAIDGAISFMESAFGDGREMLLLMTELTARSSTAGFIGRFGSESYFAHNDELMVDRNRSQLIEDIQNFDLGE